MASIWNPGGFLAAFRNFLRVPSTETVSELPIANTRKGKLLGFNAITGDVEVVDPPSGSDLETRLANGASDLEGAGLVAYDNARDYLAGTVGKAIKDLEDAAPAPSGGGTFIGVNILDFIPEVDHADIKAGTSTLDCRPYFEAALAELAGKGGILWVPKGTYEVSKNPLEQCCILITCPIILRGEGRYSAIKPKSDVGALTNTITIRPSTSFDVAELTIEHLFLGNPTNGLRTGNYGIFIDTQASDTYLPNALIRSIFVGESGTYAIAHLHNPTRAPSPANGATGGVYGLTIANNRLRGGISLENTGDSVYIHNNIISGASLGIFASIINGASQLHIKGNNITSLAGAIKLDRASRPIIEGNNIEQLNAVDVVTGNSTLSMVTNSNSGSMINLAGGNGLIVQPVIRYNNLGAFTKLGPDAEVFRSIRCSAGVGGIIEDNGFLPSTATQYGIAIFAGWSHMRVGWNQYGSGSPNRVADDGVGTMGVARSYQGLLQNGWVPFGANFADCYYIKDGEGYVTIQGAIKDGTTTAGTIIFQLPEDYRPSRSEYFLIYSQTTLPAQVIGSILVNAAFGNVIVNAGANGMMSLNCTFLAAKRVVGTPFDARYGSGSSNLGYGAGNVSDL